MSTNTKTDMYMLSPHIFKSAEIQNLSELLQYMAGLESPRSLTLGILLSFVTPIKEVRLLSHVTSCPNDSMRREMSSLLGVQSSIWLPGSSRLAPQMRERLPGFPTLQFSQADRGISYSPSGIKTSTGQSGLEK